MGGQEEWEGRRRWKEVGMGGQEALERSRDGRAGGEESRTQRTVRTHRTNTFCNHLVSSLTGD